MSNIFAPWVRPWGTLPIEVGSGPVGADGEDTQHLRFTDEGRIYCSNDTIAHYGAALPFDQYGRLVVSTDDVAWWDQDIPFTASGAVAMREGTDPRWDQGLTFLPTGHISTGDTAPPPEPPVWSTIPGKTNYQYELPDTYDVSPYVSSPGTPITGYSLVAPPAGFSIDANGIITADGAAVGAHVITVRATNSEGSTDTTFTWNIVLGNTPVWSPIPTQSHRVNTLPKTLDIKPYVTSDSGPLTGYSLVTPPAGFSISGGVITAAAGTAVAVHVLTVRATNGVGASDTTFNWEILEELVPPQWSQIPNQNHTAAQLPASVDISGYVTSNSGTLRNWSLVTPPTGFSINQSGVITAAAGTAETTHNIVVSVENDTGSATSGFTWTISAELFPPQWSTIPDQSTSENLLPTILDVSPYVSSNSGPLTGWTLIGPPPGFTINGSGVITVAAGTAVGQYSITVEVTNDTGTTQSTAFTWEVLLFYLVPQWSVIPSQSTGDDDLPTTLDVAPYVTTNSGPLVGWTLVAPPAGFTIDAAGVITVAGGTALANHSITVAVDNDEGTGTSAAFSWVIFDTPIPPVWSTIPDQSTREDNLPATLDAAAYVSSNAGTLHSWALVSPPAGFSIDSAGLITVADGTAPSAGYSLQVQVTNDEGTEVSNIFSWEIVSYYLPPQWSTIPAQSTEEQLLPVVFDVKPYVTSNAGPLTSWSLVLPPSGWTISNDGIITVASGRVVNTYDVTVRVSNDFGTADSASFEWDILEEPLPPQWSPIPNKQTRENLLPQTYNVSTYVSSNAGPLTTWTLVNPPAGFTISGAGVITAAAGTAVAIHSLTVRVSNDEGTEDSAAFTWEIQEELLPPQWSTVPDKSDRINTLPQTYDMSFYVTSNSGSLILWQLDSAPAGFSINSSTGVVTATASAGIGDHTLRVSVANAEGRTSSNNFQWEILEELLGPQWSPIPNQSDPADSLPQTLDVKPYVTSNSGPLTNWQLVSPPSGFSIDSNGIVTCASGTAQAAHQIKVRVSNDTGTADSAFFTWTVEAPAVNQYYHDFNASLGGDGFWSFIRTGNQTALDAGNSTRRQVGSNIPAYPGCGWGGSSFTPNAGFRGILLEGQATNQFWWSTKFFPSDEVNWKWGNGWGTKCPTTSAREQGFNYVWDGNQQATMSMDVDPSAGDTDFNWSPDNGGTFFWQTLNLSGGYQELIQTHAARAELVATFQARYSGMSFCYDWAMLETGNFHTSPIYTTNGTGTRPRCFLKGDPSVQFTAAELQQDWAMQFKFSMENPISTAPIQAWGIYSLFVTGDTTDYSIAYLGSTYIAFLIRRSGVDYTVVFDEAGVAGIDRLEEIDLRVKWTASGLTAWLAYPGQALYKKTTAQALTPWPSRTLELIPMRLEDTGSNSVNDMPGVLKAVRIEAPAPSDGDIEAWT